MSNYAIGHNLSGYSPDPDSTYIVETWEEAVEALSQTMRDYADADDDAAWDYLNTLPTDALMDYPIDGEGTVDFGDDTPSMLATVDSIITDAFPLTNENGAVTIHVTDNDCRLISFWIAPTDETPED